jgi:histidine triad (HIT) family protein
MTASIFTKIINREIPAHIIYEDEKTIAFLDINPIQPGHTLVVAKAEVDHFEDLPDEDLQALAKTVKLIMRQLREKTGVSRVCAIVEGFDVPHVHVKLVPTNLPADLHAEPRAASQEELADMAEQLSL